MFADALTRSLQRADGIEVVCHGAMSGSQAVEEFGRVRPDVALLDYFLGEVNGCQATRAIRQSSPTARVILLSGVYGPDHIEGALAVGASGFLPKSLGVAQVVEAIRQAHRGRPLVYADDLANLLDELRVRIRHGDDLYSRYGTLTEHELDILRHLGEGKTTSEAAKCLAMSAGTMKNQLTRIFAKTGAATRMEAIDTARRTGLLRPRQRAGG